MSPPYALTEHSSVQARSRHSHRGGDHSWQSGKHKEFENDVLVITDSCLVLGMGLVELE